MGTSLSSCPGTTHDKVCLPARVLTFLRRDGSLLSSKAAVSSTSACLHHQVSAECDFLQHVVDKTRQLRSLPLVRKVQNDMNRTPCCYLCHHELCRQLLFVQCRIITNSPPYETLWSPWSAVVGLSTNHRHGLFERLIHQFSPAGPRFPAYLHFIRRSNSAKAFKTIVRHSINFDLESTPP